MTISPGRPSVHLSIAADDSRTHQTMCALKITRSGGPRKLQFYSKTLLSAINANDNRQSRRRISVAELSNGQRSGGVSISQISNFYSRQWRSSRHTLDTLRLIGVPKVILWRCGSALARRTRGRSQMQRLCVECESAR